MDDRYCGGNRKLERVMPYTTDTFKTRACEQKGRLVQINDSLDFKVITLSHSRPYWKWSSYLYMGQLT